MVKSQNEIRRVTEAVEFAVACDMYIGAAWASDRVIGVAGLADTAKIPNTIVRVKSPHTVRSEWHPSALYLLYTLRLQLITRSRLRTAALHFTGSSPSPCSRLRTPHRGPTRSQRTMSEHLTCKHPHSWRSTALPFCRSAQALTVGRHILRRTRGSSLLLLQD